MFVFVTRDLRPLPSMSPMSLWYIIFWVPLFGIKLGQVGQVTAVV